jgi:hypothetical protein
MRETRQQVRLRDPVTLLLVPRRGRGVSAGGVSRRGATARDGVRADHDARARASRDARVKNLSASTRRVEGLEKYRRVDVAIAVSRAVGRERCAARTRPRSPKGGDASTESHQVPDPKRPDVPLPGGGPVRGHPRRRLTNARRERRRVDACDFYLGLAVLRTMASAWARTEKARAPKTSTRSRWLAPACARRKCVVLARLSSARPRVVRAFRRLRAKLFDDEPRRHLLTASEGTAQVATTRASTGLTV